MRTTRAGGIDLIHAQGLRAQLFWDALRAAATAGNEKESMISDHFQGLKAVVIRACLVLLAEATHPFLAQLTAQNTPVEALKFGEYQVVGVEGHVCQCGVRPSAIRS
jgi:hypothetical protein